MTNLDLKSKMAALCTNSSEILLNVLFISTSMLCVSGPIGPTLNHTKPATNVFINYQKTINKIEIQASLACSVRKRRNLSAVADGRFSLIAAELSNFWSGQHCLSFCLMICMCYWVRRSRSTSLFRFFSPFTAITACFLSLFIVCISIDEKPKCDWITFPPSLFPSVCFPLHSLPLSTSFWRLDNLCIHEQRLKVKGLKTRKQLGAPDLQMHCPGPFSES